MGETGPSTALRAQDAEWRQEIDGLRRPLVPLVIAFLLGIVAARLLQLPAVVWLLAGLAAAGLALLSAVYSRLRAAGAFLLLLFFSLGAGRLGVESYLLPPHHIDRLSEVVLEQPLLIEGVVASPSDFPAVDVGGVENDERRVRVLLDLRTIWLAGREIRVAGRARLTLLNPEIVPAYGERLRGQFKLRRPRGYRNPGGFDYPLYLRSRDVTLEGWAGEASPIERRGTDGGRGPLAVTYALRDRLIHAVNGLLPPEQASLLMAMTLGERSGIPRRITEAFTTSGTYHILAISGLNVSLLAGALFFLLKAVRVPLRVSALLSMSLITFYAGLAGGGASVVRAAVMADVYLLGLVLDREADSLNTLALSALGLLLWQPLYLFDVGFQLTFVATGAIVVAVNRLPSLHCRCLAMGCHAAGIVDRSLPWDRPDPRLDLPSALAYRHPGQPPDCAFERSADRGRDAVCRIGDGRPPLSRMVCRTHRMADRSTGQHCRLVCAAAFCLGPAFFSVHTDDDLLLRGPGNGNSGHGTPVAPIYRVRSRRCCVVLIGVRLSPIFQNGPLRMTVLDVGQGDAIVLELPGKRTILIDGGGLFDDRFDIGEQVVVPFLLSRWIGHLDAVILSHPHPDHLNGLQAVLRHIPIGQVWDSGQRTAMPTYLWLEEVLRDKRIPHKILHDGYRTSEFAPVQIAVLHPSNAVLYGSPRGHFSDVNSNSLVLSVRYGKVTLLLPGDIEQEAEERLLEQGADLQAQVLKVPHHGGRTSSSEPFLARVHPRVAVVSAGYRNRFRHPHQETLDRYRANGIHLYRTDLDGAVTVSSDGNTVDVTTFRQSGR